MYDNKPIYVRDGENKPRGRFLKVTLLFCGFLVAYLLCFGLPKLDLTLLSNQVREGLLNHDSLSSTNTRAILEFLNGNALTGEKNPLWTTLHFTDNSRSYEWLPDAPVSLYRTNSGYGLVNASAAVEFNDSNDLFSLVWDGHKFTEPQTN